MTKTFLPHATRTDAYFTDPKCVCISGVARLGFSEAGQGAVHGSNDPISCEVQRIADLSDETLMDEVAEMAASWSTEHHPHLSGNDGISGTEAITQAYRIRLFFLRARRSSR